MKRTLIHVLFAERTTTILFYVLLVWAARDAHTEEQPEAKVRVTTLDGKQVEGFVTALTTGGDVTLQSPAAKMSWDEVRSLEVVAASSTGKRGAMPPQDAAVVVLRPKGQVFVEELVIKDERVRWRWHGQQTVETTLDAVATIAFPRAATDKTAPLPLPAPAADHDQVLLRSQDSVQTVDGLLEELSTTHATIQFEGRTVQLPREKLVGIVLANPPQPAIAKSGCEIVLRDGQSFVTRQATLRAGERSERVLQVEFAAGGKGEVAWSDIARIEHHASRLQFLSDLRPTQTEHEAIVTTASPWRADRSVQGNPLTLGGKSFPKGLGVHAPTRLTYQIDEDYESFAAVVGVDDETAGRGDCVFSALGDDQVLWTQRCRGGEPSHVVRIPIGGIRRLTLVVDAGEDLDLADHADWADAYLLRKKLTKSR